jgi:hypothetical protein
MESIENRHFPFGPMESFLVKKSPEEVTPAFRERHRKLMEMAIASFPNGVPDPFASVLLLNSVSEGEQFLVARE